MANWTISNLEYTNDSNKAVITAHWRCEAIDGAYKASAFGACSFTPDPSDPAYIPYESLTENDVIVWVWGDVDKIKTEAVLASKIAAQQNPPVQSGLPWEPVQSDLPQE